MSIAEIGGGMHSAERREVTRLLSSLTVFPVTERIAWRAAEFMRAYRRAHTRIGLGDYLIAGTTDIEGLTLATLNHRQFPMFPELSPPFQLS